ncbi:hypothetical protein SLEP1_g16055 [Rubroshorea leprosula]|uniref:Maturase K n=1 Tax=Rubroshorea leprosula TaxID=152421 RepID=A0AAV5IYE4_9ROSI|nr:hypothetical protein SLEP1_g16055 [Rubroshorea leprosula]
MEGSKFGEGPRELGGAVDLITQFKLWPYHEFFCKRLLHYVNLRDTLSP